MNCDTRLPRYLCFTRALGEEQVSAAKSIGAVNPIIRKHTDSYEFDFRFPGDPMETELPDALKTTEIIAAEYDFASLTAEQILADSGALIAEERFWESHNLLEELWQRSTGDRKSMLHDVIGLVVSQIKVQMGQWEVGKKVYERSAASLGRMGVESIVEQLPEDFAYPLKISLEPILPLMKP